MRQLMFLGPGRAEWQEAPEPAIGGALEAIVEPLAVATCDLDVAILRGTFRAFPGPFPLGHEGVARVTDIGEAVSSVAPGDLVVVPFQVSCGTCRACQAGRTGNCASVPRGSMYGYEPFGGRWGGFLADAVRVPYADAMLVRLDPGVDPVVVASLSDNVPDAWRTVGPPLADAPGSEVLIVGGGGGSVPLYAVALALALGAPAVRYLDRDAEARSSSPPRWRTGRPLPKPCRSRRGSWSWRGQGSRRAALVDGGVADLAGPADAADQGAVDEKDRSLCRSGT